MFKTAGVHSIRRAFSGLSLVFLAVILGACAHPPTTDSVEPKRRIIENVASKSTAELYADLIAPAVFERSSSKVIDGYTVESGKLRLPDKSEGSLVTVRSADGSLTALINKPGRFGSLHVDSQGVSAFIPEPEAKIDIEDAVPNPNEQAGTASVDSTQAEHFIVDVLMGYSKAGVIRAGGDAHADALAKIELVNMMLRNSLVDNVSLRLVGIQVVEDDYPITTETLGKVRTIFAEGIAKFEPDVTYGNFAYILPGGAVGWGWTPGGSAIGVSHSASTFAHEIGHNAGSNHCNVNGVNNYRFGYFNGKSRSILCGGSNSLYYSTPAVIDQYGLPLGNAVTADTARVWRENAVRLSSYAPPQSPPTAPENFAKVGSTARTITFSWNASPKAVRYEIYSVIVSDSNIFPVKIGDSTALTFTATNIYLEALYFVKAVSFIGMVSLPSNSVVATP